MYLKCVNEASATSYKPKCYKQSNDMKWITT